MLYILPRLLASLRSMPLWDNYSSLSGSFNRQPATGVVSNEEGRRRRRPSSQFNLVAASSFSGIGRIVIYISKKAPERLNLTIDRHLRLCRRRPNVTILRAANKSRPAPDEEEELKRFICFPARPLAGLPARFYLR